MLRSPWKDAEFVSSESGYVGELIKDVVTVVGLVREGVEQKKYVRSVCDKIVGYVPFGLLEGLSACVLMMDVRAGLCSPNLLRRLCDVVRWRRLERNRCVSIRVVRGHRY